MHRKLLIGLAILTIAISALSGGDMSLEAQNMSNVSNFTGVENVSSSGSVAAKLNISTPEPEPDDYPAPSPTDE